MAERRIVLLGKTGVGKSSLANTIFGEKIYKVSGSSNSETSECQSETREVGGRKITIIDTPGFFDTNKCEDDLKSEMAKCVTESAPGVHAFLIVLKVDRFTQQEKEIISKIKKSFSKEALKYAVILFTRGDQLEDQKIEEFVNENDDLRGLVKECGGRCHVIDNRHWDKERNNNEVEKLLNTIDKMVEQNNGDMYTNEMLKQVHSMLEKEEELIRASSKNMSAEEIKKESKRRVSDIMKKVAGISTGVLLGALLGIPMMVGRALCLFKSLVKHIRIEEIDFNKAIDVLRDISKPKAIAGKDAIKVISGAAGFGAAGFGAAGFGAAGFSAAESATTIGAKTSAAAVGFYAAAGICCAIGAVKGGVTGYIEAVEADSAGKAATNTAKAVWESTISPFKEVFQTEEQTKNIDTKKD